MIKRITFSLLLSFSLIASPLMANDPDSREEKSSVTTLADWATKTQANVLETLEYPTSAYTEQLKGIVIIRLTVSKSGEILVADLVKSSGIAVFDEAAKALAKTITVPALPNDYPKESFIFDLKLEYDITD